jgi:L-Ala-D/L-Glu epimerase
MHVQATMEDWPLAKEFRISRGAKTSAVVVVATVTHNGVTGRGECTPYARYGETPERTCAEILSAAAAMASAAEPFAALAQALGAGAARNALDAALWDLRAKAEGTPVWQRLRLPPPAPVQTAYTLSLDTAEAMAAAAKSAPFPLLKLKLGGAGDVDRLRAVRVARPDARLIVDANEAWPEAELLALFTAAADAGVEVVEQPLPAGRDAALAARGWPVPVCADESAHTADGVAALADRYNAVNIKLDKTGGLTGALQMLDAATAIGMDVMIGCMTGTSLAMAPALLLAPSARWVDLDGPLLLARDREFGIPHHGGGMIGPASNELWGA